VWPFPVADVVIVGLVTALVVVAATVVLVLEADVVDEWTTVLDAVEQSNPMLWIPTLQLLFPPPEDWLG
jgi:uncharacterized membrane protein